MNVPVEISIGEFFDKLTILEGNKTGDLRVYVDATQKELENMPAYK